jgi:hypothetical protein
LKTVFGLASAFMLLFFVLPGPLISAAGNAARSLF